MAVKARTITCERCDSPMAIADDIPKLPAAKAHTCKTCHAFLVVWRDLADAVRVTVATRTGQATA